MSNFMYLRRCTNLSKLSLSELCRSLKYCSKNVINFDLLIDSMELGFLDTAVIVDFNSVLALEKTDLVSFCSGSWNLDFI